MKAAYWSEKQWYAECPVCGETQEYHDSQPEEGEQATCQRLVCGESFTLSNED